MISIIVPVYKVELELPRCIESLTKQTYHDIEIVLVDDGSPDRCPEICEQYAAADSRIKVIHKPNGGLSDARNAGLQMATGDYVLYVDSDDYIEPTTCERFAAIADQDAPDIIVGEARQIEGKHIKNMGHSNLEEGKVYSAREYILLAAPKGEWYAPAWFNLYRKDYLLENSLFFVKGLLHEDMEMLPRVFLAAEKVAYLNYTFYFYVVRENSIMTGSQKEKSAESMRLIYAEWKKLFDSVEDEELQLALYGFLVKCYMATCRNLKLSSGFEIEGLNNKFLVRYTLNPKEKIKAAIFALNRKIYVRL